MSLQLGFKLTSGQKTWFADISNFKELLQRARLDTLNSFKAAFRKSTLKALDIIETEELPTVAMDTGLMRAAFMNSFDTNFDMSLSQDYAQGTFRFNVSKFTSDLSYSAYHLVQSGAFAFPQGYKLATTPNTEPVDLIFFNQIAELLASEIVHNMRLWGFDVL